jgi:hypothetical protein
MPYGKGASRYWKIATAEAEREGFHSFKKGSSGYEKRSQIAEALARKAHKRSKK